MKSQISIKNKLKSNFNKPLEKQSNLLLRSSLNQLQHIDNEDAENFSQDYDESENNNDQNTGPIGFNFLKKYHNKALSEDIFKITKRAR